MAREPEDNPYRLHYTPPAPVILRRKGAVLKAGLGCMGVGQMWFDADDTDPKYDGVPYEDESPGHNQEGI